MQFSIRILIRTFVRVNKLIWIYSDIHLCNFVDTNIFGHSFVSKFSRMSHSDANYIGCICLTFSIVCFKCLLKWPASEYAYSHWLYDCLISLDCVFSNVSSNCVGHGMQKNIGCNSNTVCSIDVFSKCLLWRMDYHTNCTCGLFSTVLLNVSSTCMSGRMQSHTECISLTFLHCAFSNVFSNCLPGTFL